MELGNLRDCNHGLEFLQILDGESKSGCWDRAVGERENTHFMKEKKGLEGRLQGEIRG